MLCVQERGGAIAYKATVDSIITQGSGSDATAIGVRMRDGTEVRADCVVSNATRWDTFGRLVPFVPENEAKFRKRYVKSPSFITLHLGIKAECLPVRCTPFFLLKSFGVLTPRSRQCILTCWRAACAGLHATAHSYCCGMLRRKTHGYAGL